MKKIRVLIIDEHPAVCRALVARLGAVPSIEVVGATSTFADGVSCAVQVKPDLVILEVKGKGGADVDHDPIAQIAQAMHDWPAGVIVLTSYPDEQERLQALQAGARRYLLKNIDSALLIEEIETVAREVLGATNHPALPIPKDQTAGAGSVLGHRC